MTTAERLEHVKTMPRSVSQLKEYRDCPHRYYLARVERVWQRPAAWLPQGLAVHEAAEAFERSGRTMTLDEAQDVYRASYEAHTNRLCEDTPRFDYWFASGPYRGEEDVERRYTKGLEQVEKYLAYYAGKGSQDVIWITPDGEPAIELAFDFDLDGVRVRGFIDAVIVMPDGSVRVRDNKTGNKPGDDLQLATYAVAVRETHGQAVNHGDYWMGRTGKPTVLYDLFEWGRDEVASVFGEMDRAVKAGRFEPKPDPDRCRFCSVSSSCSFSAA